MDNRTPIMRGLITFEWMIAYPSRRYEFRPQPFMRLGSFTLSRTLTRPYPEARAYRRG